LKRFFSFLFILGLFTAAVYFTALYLIERDVIQDRKNPASNIEVEVDLGNGLETVNIEKRQFLSTPLSIAYTDSPTYLSVDGILRWTNRHRETENLKDLALNKTLNSVAAANYFEHVSPDGVGPGDLAREFEYDFIIVGENLAKGNFKTDKKLVQAWMDSPGHRENIMKPNFSEIGIAVGQATDNGREVWLAVQSFGTPKRECGEPENPSQLNSFREAINREVEDLQIFREEIETQQSEFFRGRDFESNIEQYNARVQDLKDDQARFNEEVVFINEANQKYSDCIKNLSGK